MFDVKVKIINKSSKHLPQEVVDSLTFKTIDEANTVLEDYNLRISEYITEYERVLNGARDTKEQIFIIDDKK